MLVNTLLNCSSVALVSVLVCYFLLLLVKGFEFQIVRLNLHSIGMTLVRLHHVVQPLPLDLTRVLILNGLIQLLLNTRCFVVFTLFNSPLGLDALINLVVRPYEVLLRQEHLVLVVLLHLLLPQLLLPIIHLARVEVTKVTLALLHLVGIDLVVNYFLLRVGHCEHVPHV